MTLTAHYGERVVEIVGHPDATHGTLYTVIIDGDVVLYENPNLGCAPVWLFISREEAEDFAAERVGVPLEWEEKA